MRWRSTSLALLFGAAFELLLQRRELGKRRIRIDRTLARRPWREIAIATLATPILALAFMPVAPAPALALMALVTLRLRGLGRFAFGGDGRCSLHCSVRRRRLADTRMRPLTPTVPSAATAMASFALVAIAFGVQTGVGGFAGRLGRLTSRLASAMLTLILIAIAARAAIVRSPARTPHFHELGSCRCGRRLGG
jgi:hypothetical protein